MYISKGTAGIIACILMLGGFSIVFYLLGTSLGSSSETQKEKRTFLDAMAIFLFITAIIISGIFGLTPD